MSFVERKRVKFFGLPLSFTKYTITEEKLTITSGFLSITEDDAYMYKIQDVRLTRSLSERIFKLGTITCYTGDTTHPELILHHIKHSSQIKDFIMTSSEEARRKRRSLHTLNIDAQDLDEEELAERN
ncbi:PH domain-containing protein [Lachnospiraceae bacterium MD1]|uniref:PH domain-containing protein n=1 Tax=Variimorphobacter saccharofermentans TaxID=2755051 RepID=A0A839JZ37_9FIRM|nr:PH domain-containing protein [Variimorphobacter saccharofermentans]MBB2182478.1 PH domain-containing protein [Variimorphobacter saccharofermentans]